MDITAEDSIGKLVCVYTKSTSTVLICETAKDVDIDYWEIYLNDIFYSVANNSDTGLGIRNLYFRVLELDRNTEYSAYVKGVKDGVGKSEASNTVTFNTFI